MPCCAIISDLVKVTNRDLLYDPDGRELADAEDSGCDVENSASGDFEGEGGEAWVRYGKAPNESSEP